MWQSKNCKGAYLIRRNYFAILKTEMRRDPLNCFKTIKNLTKIFNSVINFEYDTCISYAVTKILEKLECLNKLIEFIEKQKKSYKKWDNEPPNITFFHKDITILLI